MRVAVRLYKTKDVFDPRRLVLGPDAQRVAVGIQATSPETLHVGVQKSSLSVVGGILDCLGELGAHALEVGRVISARQGHDSFSVGKTEASVEVGVFDGREEHLEVAALLCFADSRVLGKDGISLEDLGNHLNIVLRDTGAHIVRALCDVARIAEAVGGDGDDGQRDFVEQLQQLGRLGGEPAKKISGYIGHKLLIARALGRSR